MNHVDYVVSKEIFIHVSLLVHTVVHGFVNGTYDVVEGESLDTIFQLNVKGETRFSSVIVSGTISAVAGDSTSKFNYNHRLIASEVTLHSVECSIL